LRIRGIRQFLGWTLKAQAPQRHTENLFSLGEDPPSGFRNLMHSLSHSHMLASLPWKEQR